MSLVGIDPKEYTASCHTDIHTPMFAAELVTLAKTIHSGLGLRFRVRVRVSSFGES